MSHRTDILDLRTALEVLRQNDGQLLETDIPVLSWYHQPKSIEDCTRHIVGKMMGQFGLESKLYQCWEGVSENEPND